MAELKTQRTTKDPIEFINTVESEEKKSDSFKLLEIFQEVTGEKPAMWGESIIGFGMYHYKSERSRQEGDWPLVGFSPRKQNITLYIMAGNDKDGELMKSLGKHTSSVSCVYIKRLSDVDEETLKKVIRTCYDFMKKTNNVA